MNRACVEHSHRIDPQQWSVPGNDDRRMSQNNDHRSTPADRETTPGSRSGSGGHFYSAQGSTKAGTKDISRRSLLALGGVVGVGLVVGAIAVDSQRTDNSKGSLSQASTDTLAFASTDITTARWVTTQTGETAPGYLFVTPLTSSSCGTISENSGQPVWMANPGVSMSDLQVQQYNGNPVLTYWSGTRVRGYGRGVGNILDAEYKQIAKVQAAPGLQADLHEFLLTPQGTALLIAYVAKPADLSTVHGPTSGFVLDCHVNEVDIQTGKVLLDWSAHQHVSPDETYASVKNAEDGDGKSASRAFDAYHLSSIDFDDQSLYISARNTHTVYRINRTTGHVEWRLGGKKSDFTVAKDAQFAWQNHFRLRPDGMASLFNNRTRDAKADVRSAAFLLTLDTSTMKAGLQKKFEHGAIVSTDMGSADLLENGNWLVGWGTQPLVTEHAPDGKAVYTATLADSPSDRAFRSAWVASPQTAPAISIVHGSGRKMLVDVSWNGATEVRNWQFMTGASPSTMQPVKVVPKSDFETAGTLPRAPYAAAQALGLNGNVLATTPVAASTD